MTTHVAGKRTVLLADDHPVLMEGLVATLAPYYEVVGQVQTLDELRPAIEQCRPDVVVLDLLFDGDSSIPLLRELLADPTIQSRFVMLSGANSSALATATIAAGAMAFLPKGVGVQQLRQAIDAALAGERYVVDAGGGENVEESSEAAVWIGGIRLRRRQVEVLALLLTGIGRSGVAAQLNLSMQSVDFHLANVRRRLGVHTSRQVLAWAAEHRDQFPIGDTTAPPIRVPPVVPPSPLV